MTLTVAVILIVFSLLAPAVAQERTGAILKELIAAVERDIETMEAEVERFASERQTLLGDWQQTREALARANNPLQRDSLRADLLLLGAKLNQGDLQQVRTYLTTIAGLIPKLQQLKEELGLGSMGASRATRQATHTQLGTLMTNAANLLSGLQTS